MTYLSYTGFDSLLFDSFFLIFLHYLKFIYSEKATKFCEISTVDLTNIYDLLRIYELDIKFRDKYVRNGPYRKCSESRKLTIFISEHRTHENPFSGFFGIHHVRKFSIPKLQDTKNFGNGPTLICMSFSD